MSLQKGSRSQRHTRAGAKWDNCTGIAGKPLHTLYCYKKATCGQAWQSHTDLRLGDTHTTFLLPTAENPKLTELKWGWCLHPNPGTAVFTAWTRAKLLLLLFVHSKGANYNKVSLKPFGCSVLNFGASVLVYLTLKCHQQKPSSHWGNTTTGKVIFRGSFCCSIRSSNTLTQLEQLFLNTAIVCSTKASLLWLSQYYFDKTP